MKIVSFICAICCALFASAVANADTSAPPPPGSYQDTCTDIEATWNTLSATCERRDGNWNYTTLSGYRSCDGDIANQNGRLKCVTEDDGGGDDWLPRGSYRDTCRNIEADRDTIKAECKDNFGRWRYTELFDYRSCRADIYNDHGILRCYRDEETRMPGGNWRTSCRSARLTGSVLWAECRDFFRVWRATSLDLRRCPRANVSNVRGRLTCSSYGGGGGGGSEQPFARITLFRDAYFTGRSRTFTTDVPDLNAYGFGDQASSILIESGVWQVCDRPYFRGYCIVLDRAQSSLSRFGFDDRAESIRRVR